MKGNQLKMKGNETKMKGNSPKMKGNESKCGSKHPFFSDSLTILVWKRITLPTQNERKSIENERE